MVNVVPVEKIGQHDQSGNNDLKSGLADTSAISSFERLKSALLRGGRMTKVAGTVASYAPQLGVALVAAGPLLMSGLTAAYADPTPPGAGCADLGGGTFECTGTTTTTQNLSPPAGQALTVSTTEKVNVIVSSGNALTLANSAGDTDITFTDTYGSTITGADNGIGVTGEGTGAVSITTSGSVSSGASRRSVGIKASNAGNGLTIQAASVMGNLQGIFTRLYGSGQQSITVSGDVTGAGGEAIYASNRSGTTNLIIQANSVMGNSGIYASNQGNGFLSITTSGDVAAASGFGVYGANSGSGTDLTIQTTSVQAGGAGIIAANNGTGAVSVTTSGNVVGSNEDGINAVNRGSSLTIQATSVMGGRDGIDADNRGTGASSITATGAVRGTRSYGILASNFGTDLTIDVGDVTGNTGGIVAANSGTGTLSITSSGAITTSGGTGLQATNSGTDLTIAVRDVTGNTGGISAVNRGSGTISITVSGDVDGGLGSGITTSGSDANIMLNGGTLSARSGVAIFDAYTADTVVSVNSGAVVMGAIQLGNGSDTIVLAGGDVSGVTSFDGGDDSSIGDGFIDTIRVTGTTTLAGAGVTNFERVDVESGGTLSLSESVISIGDGSVGTGLSVRSGGTFNARSGTTTISGRVSNSGTLQVPAGATLKVSGDTTFNAGGRLRVGVASDTSAGSLSVTGGVTFESGSEVFADLTKGITLTEGGEIKFVNATTGITDNGLTVDDNSALVSFTHEVRGGELYLTVKPEANTRALSTTIDNNGRTNAESIAAAIDVLIDSAPADNPIVKYLAQFPVEQQTQKLFELVKESLPSEVGASGSSTVVTTDLVIDLIMGRLSGGTVVADTGAGQSGIAAGEQFLGGPGNWALWGQAGASFAAFDPSGVNGFDSDTYGISVGMDGDIAQDLRMGLAVFYSDTSVDETGAGANSAQDIDGYGVLLYGAYRPSDFFVNATLGYGLNEYDSQRLSLGGVNTANYDGIQFMSRVEVGKTFTEGKFDLTPHAGLRYTKVSIDGYTETGPLPTTIASQDLTSLRGVLGLSGSYTHELDNGGKLIPEAYIRGLQELADPNDAITGNVVGGGSFVSQTVKRDKFSYAVGGGLGYELGDHASFRLLYDGEFQTDYQEHAVTASIRYQF